MNDMLMGTGLFTGFAHGQAIVVASDEEVEDESDEDEEEQEEE